MEHFRNEKTLRKVITAYVPFSTCVLAFQYFYSFDYGETDAPYYVRWIKEFFWIWILFLYTVSIFLAKGKLLKIVKKMPAFYLAFVILFFLVSIIHISDETYMDIVRIYYKNFLAFSVIMPILLSLSPAGRLSVIANCSNYVVFIAVIQVFFGFLLMNFAPEQAIWHNDPVEGFDPLIGFFGNPNRFALFVNIATALLYARLLRSRSMMREIMFIILITFFGVGILFSGATSQIVVLFGMLMYGAAISFFVSFRAVRNAVMAVGCIAILMVIFFSDVFPRGSFLSDVFTKGTSVNAYVIDSFQSLIGLERVETSEIGPEMAEGSSKGVSDAYLTRVREISHLPEQWYALNIWTLLVGDIRNVGMIRQHNEFINLFFNCGLIVFASFLIFLLQLGISSLVMSLNRSGSLESVDLILGYHLALACFVATSLVDQTLMDYPTNFLFFFIIGALAVFHRDFFADARGSHTVA